MCGNTVCVYLSIVIVAMCGLQMRSLHTLLRILFSMVYIYISFTTAICALTCPYLLSPPSLQDVIECSQHLSGKHSWFSCSHPRFTYCNVCGEALHGVAWHGLSCEGMSHLVVCNCSSSIRCRLAKVVDESNRKHVRKYSAIHCSTWLTPDHFTFQMLNTCHKEMGYLCVCAL